jgi:uncharacterized RDD family membrane protein YckC
VTANVAADRDLGLQGRYAGFVTRFVAFGFDILTVLALFAMGAAIAEYVISALVGTQVHLSDAPILAEVLLGIWWFAYCAYPLAQAGRTFGMAIVGLRVVRSDGHVLGPAHAVLRVLVFPLSFLLFGVGFLLILVRRDRRALHDLIDSSAVVYAWDARAARLRLLAKKSE